MSDDGVDRIHEFIKDARRVCDDESRNLSGLTKVKVLPEGVAATCFDKYLANPNATSMQLCYQCRSVRCKYDLWAYDHKNKVYDRYLADCMQTIGRREAF